MKFFSKKELKAIAIIFLGLIVISVPNFIISLRRARDAQREADVGSIQGALFKYDNDFGSYPLSINGKIAACNPVEFTKTDPPIPVFSACDFGKDSLRDLSDASFAPYLQTIPDDPQAKNGPTYYYLSDGQHFQIYASLEGKDEAEYDPAIAKRDLPCGSKICNSGKSSGKVPLNISIEDYINETEK